MWDKWIFLATLAAATGALRASIGHRPEPAQLETYRNTLTEAGSPLKASMLRDLESGGRTETEHVIGDMVRRAEAADVAVPLLRFALTHLQAYELQRGRV